MSINLVIDIGNTQSKVALFSENGLVGTKVFPGVLNVTSVKKFIANNKIHAAIISSVTNHPSELNKWLKKRFVLIELGGKTKLPIRNRYKTRDTLGKDRLANAAGANYLFPGENVLVIDAGTCIKYDFINAKAQYSGGAISPGIDMRFRALNEFTAHLPRLKKTKGTMPELIGSSTNNSIVSGVMNGLMAEVEGIIFRYKKKYKSLVCVITGGDNDIFVPLISKKNRIFAAPDLTLLGLNIILNYNNGSASFTE